MAIKYSIKAIKNPQPPQPPALYYPQIQIKEKVDISYLAKEMAYGTSLKEEIVLTVIEALGEIIKGHLANGNSVNLGELGTFQYQIHGKGAGSLEEFDPKTNIQEVKIQFRAGNWMRAVSKNVKFKYLYL